MDCGPRPLVSFRTPYASGRVRSERALRTIQGRAQRLLRVQPCCSMKTNLFPVTLLCLVAGLASSALAQEIVVKEKVEKPSLVAGNIVTIDPSASTIVITSEGAAAPSRYVFTDDTEFVDESGNAVAHSAFNEGEAATVQYVRAGDKLVVIKATLGAPVAPQTTTTTTQVVQPAPVVTEETMVEETTAAPEVAVEKKVVKKKAAVKKEPKVEKKAKVVVKEKKPKVIEEKKTTTTTTTDGVVPAR